MATYAVKGSFVRGFLGALEARGRKTATLSSLASGVRARLEPPPAASAWVDGDDLSALESATEALYGPEGLRQTAHDATQGASLPILRSLIEGLVRLFGATPETFLSRMSLIAAQGSRGFEYQYVPETKRSGTIVVRIASASVSSSVFTAYQGSLVSVFAVCGEKGVVEAPVITTGPQHTEARLMLRW